MLLREWAFSSLELCGKVDFGGASNLGARKAVTQQRENTGRQQAHGIWQVVEGQ